MAASPTTDATALTDDSDSNTSAATGTFAPTALTDNDAAALSLMQREGGLLDRRRRRRRRLTRRRRRRRRLTRRRRRRRQRRRRRGGVRALLNARNEATAGVGGARHFGPVVGAVGAAGGREGRREREEDEDGDACGERHAGHDAARCSTRPSRRLFCLRAADNVSSRG